MSSTKLLSTFNATKPLFLCLAGLAMALTATPGLGQGHIHELYYNDSNWVDSDLTSVTGANPASAFAGMAGFVTTPNNQLHVYYQDEFGNIHQFYFDSSSWIDQDLTNLTGGATSRSGGSGMSGFSIGNAQYVYFVSWDQHVHEYSFVGNWVDNDLTAETGGALADAAWQGNQIVAFVTTPNNERHIYFVAGNGTVHQLYFNGSNWFDQNLTSLSRGAKARANSFRSWMGGCGVGNHQYVFFVAKNGHVHMYSFVNKWTDTDWTKRTGITGMDSVVGFAIPGTSRCEMYFNNGLLGNLEQLSYDDAHPANWTVSDLTSFTGASGSASGAVAFATTPNDQFHFYSVAGNGVDQFYFNGTNWIFQNLPGGNYWEPYGMAGFSVGNLQHVYYLASSN
jgi:hypothetical protein